MVSAATEILDGSSDAQPRPEPRRLGAYFLSLQLKNVRCFGEPIQTLDLSDGHGKPARWTILLGENGVGKTTALQSLAVFEFIYRLNHKSMMHYDDYELDHEKLLLGFPRDGHLPALSEATTVYGMNLLAVGSTLEKGRMRLELGPGGRFGVSSEDMERTPLTFAYGAGRRPGPSSLSGPISVNPVNSLFHDDVDLIDAEEWLLRADYSASKRSVVQKRQQNRLEQIKHLLIAILPGISDIRFTAPTEVQPDPGVEFHTPYGWVSLRQLGYGYRTLITWMVDLANRMLERYPNSPDPLAEPAVVLVDEIDLHLHPTWQRKLLGYLTERFQNTQFIVTAHSPLIVQAASSVNANLALLRREGDHVVIDNDVDEIRNWRIDQILTSDLFGLESARPPDLDAPLARRKQLLTKAKLTKANREELARLEKQIGELPAGETAEQVKLLERIDETMRLLKDRKERIP